MRTILLTFIIAVIATPAVVSAQGIPVPSGIEGMGFSNSSPDSAAIQSQKQEEQEGKNFLDELKNKTIACSKLKDADFEKIGEYFMGQAIGDTSRHIAMNEMMKVMMGQQGEEQAHTAMGKRMSGCDPNAPMPQNMMGNMMSMMMGSVFSRWPSGFGGTKGGGNPMMGYGGWNNMMGWGGFGLFGWVSMIIFWLLLILGVIALIRYLSRSGSNKEDKTPLNILKERYARGDINKKEFNKMKKDLY